MIHGTEKTVQTIARNISEGVRPNQSILPAEFSDNTSIDQLLMIAFGADSIESTEEAIELALLVAPEHETVLAGSKWLEGVKAISGRVLEREAEEALQAEEQARLENEAEEVRQAEEEARLENEAEEARQAEEEARLENEAEEARQAEEQARLENEAEEARQAEEQARLENEAEEARQAEEEARLENEAEEARQAEEQARLENEAEEARQAEEEARLENEAEEARQAEEEARLENEAEEARQAEEEARLENEAEEARQAEEEARLENEAEEAVQSEQLPRQEQDTVEVVNLVDAATVAVPLAADRLVADEVVALAKDVRQAVEETPAAEATDQELTDDENEESVDCEDKITVLTVDDSPTIRKLILMTLEREGFNVVQACDGIEALTLLSDVKPALILSDINMPRLDGYKLCKLVKKRPDTKHIPVIMLSGKDGVFDKLRGRMSGCDGYLTKPFESSLLLEKVRSFVATPAG